MNEETWELAAKLIIKNEGGYVNHPDDPGGETNFGISKRAYPNEDIKNMTEEKALEIYKRDYWEPVGCPNMPPFMALMAFDTAVNIGSKKTLQMLQTLAEVTSDGILGMKTKAAFAVLGLNDFKRFTTFRLLYYFTISVHNPKLIQFLQGWIYRTIKVYTEGLGLYGPKTS